MSLLCLTLLLGVPPAIAPDTVVVCPAQFQQALQPWLQHRRAQGHRIVLLPSSGSLESIRASIRQQARHGRLQWVLLVGDAAPPGVDDAAGRNGCTPTELVPARINIKWGSEPQLATDNGYADLDSDGLPELAVGRLTADSPTQLAQMVRKILQYERSAGHGAWRKRINFIAGVGGFGPLVDSVIEATTKKFLTDGIPAAYTTSMTYGSWRSPFCPDPRLFHDAALQRFNEGCLFWVYIGHGHHSLLDRVHVPNGKYHILGSQDVGKLRCVEGFPIAIFLACYTGAFDFPQDCLAERMLLADRGPVAVLSGSRVTMPYGMAVFGNGLMDEYFGGQHMTLGEVVLDAKRRMVSPHAGRPNQSATASAADRNRQLLDALAAAISPAPERLREERMEHLRLFNLLGDPLLRLHHPTDVELQAVDEVRAGRQLEVSGSCRLAGRYTMELVCRRDRTRRPFPLRREFVASRAALDAFNVVYRQANDRRWSTKVFQSAGGRFQTTLAIPDEARGPCHVCVYVQGVRDSALGAISVFIRPPEQQGGG